LNIHPTREKEHATISETDTVFEKHILVDKRNNNPIDLISVECSFSKQKVKQLLLKGCVWISRNNKTVRIRRNTKLLSNGDQLHLYYNERILTQFPIPATLIRDEEEYSIWYKPYGMYSQGSKWGDHCTLYRWAEQHLSPQRPSFIVHRLDRAANGLMILAHSKSMAAKFAQMFQQRTIHKSYEAVVHGQFLSGVKPIKISSEVQHKSAISYFSLIRYDSKHDRSHLNITIETGRKHQIRIHLSELGYPIVGDRLYGIGDEKEDLQLCSKILKFNCPLDGFSKEFILPHDLSLLKKQFNE